MTYMIYSNNEKQIYSLVLFAGLFQQNKKQKGLEIRLKWSKLNGKEKAEVTLLKGTYLENGDFVGLKKVVREGEYESYWGTFDKKLQMKGEGSSLVSVKTKDDAYEYYFHKGSYNSGKK